LRLLAAAEHLPENIAQRAKPAAPKPAAEPAALLALRAAAQRAAEASGFEAKSTMRGWAVKAPGLTIALRSA